MKRLILITGLLTLLSVSAKAQIPDGPFGSNSEACVFAVLEIEFYCAQEFHPQWCEIGISLNDWYEMCMDYKTENGECLSCGVLTEGLTIDDPFSFDSDPIRGLFERIERKRLQRPQRRRIE